MDDLIHRDELKQTLLDLGFYPAIVKSALEKAPTIDAVEVVRCRECKYFGVYRYSGNGYCTNDNGYGFPNQKPDDFCSRGERKDNG